MPLKRLMTARWGIAFGGGIALLTAMVHLLAVESDGWLGVFWWLTPTYHIVSLSWIWSGPHIALSVIAAVWLGRGMTGRLASVRLTALGVLCGLVAVGIYFPMFGLARTPSVLMHALPGVLAMLVYFGFLFLPGPLCFVLVWAAKLDARHGLKRAEAGACEISAEPVADSRAN